MKWWNCESVYLAARLWGILGNTDLRLSAFLTRGEMCTSEVSQRPNLRPALRTGEEIWSLVWNSLIINWARNLSIFPWGGASHCAPGGKFCPKYNEQKMPVTIILGKWVSRKSLPQEPVTLNVWGCRESEQATRISLIYMHSLLLPLRGRLLFLFHDRRTHWQAQFPIL